MQHAETSSVEHTAEISTTQPSATITTAQTTPGIQIQWNDTLYQRLLTAGELLLVVVWGLFVASPFLNFNVNMVPPGREYLAAIQSHHFWNFLQQCGTCALWDGNIRGGSPALVELYGSPFHPLVMLSTFVFGVVNGSKVALVGSFVLAGLAQWWLGLEAGLGRISRIWTACMMVAGGHLMSNIEVGPPGVVLSAASCVLALPPLLMLLRTTSWRAAVLFGITMALVALSGHGYLQIGFLFTLPAILILWPWDRSRSLALIMRLAFAAVLAFCLAAPFLLPLGHFWPNFAKEVDPTFNSTQSLAYVPLNLVIGDPDFYHTGALEALPFPHQYATYIGWVPVLLALWGFFGSRGAPEWRTNTFWLMLALLAIWVASAQPLAWVVDHVPFQPLVGFVSGLRFASLISKLAVAPLLVLAGIGLDRLLRLGWPRLRIMLGEAARRRSLTLQTRWVLAVPLVFALHSVVEYGRTWAYTVEVGAGVTYVLEQLRTSDIQWVDAPFGEHFFSEQAIRMNLKLANGINGWVWLNRVPPPKVLEANRLGVSEGFTPEPVVVEDGVPIYAAPPGNEYAAVTHPDGTRTVCSARGIGGHIDVSCDLSQPGTLLVYENYWTGWHAYLDGEPLALDTAQMWMTAEVPAGEQTIQLRYQPWDVWIGIMVFVVGTCLGGFVWWRSGQPPAEQEPSSEAEQPAADDPPAGKDEHAI